MSSSSSSVDLRNRIIFTIAILAVYRFGTFVPLPGIDPEQLKILMEGNQKGLLGMFNVFAGGAVSRMAIFALGIMPYISSSIIVQLLTGVSDYFKNLKAQGETGRAKIINEIPFPIPRCVICSPNHIKKIVPATIVVTVDILKNIPGLITKLAEDSKPTDKP